jgi:hypothetical protein
MKYWYQSKTKWAEGSYFNSYHYIECEPNELAARVSGLEDSLKESVGQQRGHSELYRGISLEIVTKPDAEWLRNKITDVEFSIRSNTLYLKILKAEL